MGGLIVEKEVGRKWCWCFLTFSKELFTEFEAVEDVLLDFVMKMMLLEREGNPRLQQRGRRQQMRGQYKKTTKTVVQHYGGNENFSQFSQMIYLLQSMIFFDLLFFIMVSVRRGIIDFRRRKSRK